MSLDLAGLLGLPASWAEQGVVELALAIAGALALLRAAARGGERPAREGLVRVVVFVVLAGAGAALLVRVAALVLPGDARVRALASMLAVFALAEHLVRGERTTRAFRELLRDTMLIALAGVLVAPSLALVAWIVAVEVVPPQRPSGVGAFALALASTLLLVRGMRVPSELAVALGVFVGVRAKGVRTLGFAGFGARLRRWRKASRRLAELGAERSHRVAVALAAPEPGFVIDWLRPAVQLVVDRSGVLRMAPAMPAPELVEALAAAPEGVVAARELHPYLVGAADVHAALRALELRGAAAAALLRDEESEEIVGVLYARGVERAALTETEARALRRLADVVAASIGAGSEPAIAARLKGV